MENLDLLKASYLMLQRLSNVSLETAIHTDSLRVSLRNRISELTEVSIEDLQNDVETMAYLHPIVKL